MASGSIDLTHIRFQGATADVGGGRPARRASPRLASRLACLRDACPPEGLDELPRFVLARAGIDPSIYRPRALNRRYAACLRALRVHSFDDARRLLIRDPRALEAALNALLIGVTHFFRDPAVFDAISRLVLPAVAGRPGPIRVWSLACSSGEELYSVAALLAEASLLDRSVLLGTDCRRDAIAVARAATYPGSAVKWMPAPILERYFGRHRDDWRPSRVLRARIDWQVASVTADLPAGPWDLVLWRNAAIYLAPAAARQVMLRLAGALTPGGFLVLGRAERPPADAALALVSPCIYRKGGVGDVS